MLSHSVVSDSLQPQELQPARLLCRWHTLGKNAGVSGYALLWRSSPTRDRTRVSWLLPWQAGSLQIVPPPPQFLWRVSKCQDLRMQVCLGTEVFTGGMTVNEVISMGSAIPSLGTTCGLPWWLRQQSACNAGGLDSNPGSGRSPGGGHGNPLQPSRLETPTD